MTPEIAPPEPRVGQLWMFPELGEVPEQWLVIESDASRRAVRLVPADLGSLVGSGDVAVPESSRWGVLVLRGRHPVWISWRALIMGALMGDLETEHVDRIRNKIDALSRDQRTGSIRERETDTDPDYRALDAELQRICERLAADFPSNGVPSDVAQQVSTNTRATFRWATGFLAASLIFALGFLAGRSGKPEAPGEIIAPRRSPVALHSLPWLHPEVLRGDVTTVRIEPDAATYEVVLALPFDLLPGRYELTIKEGERVVYRDAVDLNEVAEQVLQLSYEHFPPALYSVELEASDSPSLPPVRYRLQVLERLKKELLEN